MSGKKMYEHKICGRADLQDTRNREKTLIDRLIWAHI